MNKPKSREIRRRFIEYFRDQKHAVIPSSPVVPHDDPTLLFTNAGMNQFKDVFLGASVRDYTRAVSSQKCLRAGGKHNDLENVGHTKRHVTFFEMLGNFSFGDYFKEDAIKFAWEVSTEVFGFEPNRLWPTVFIDDDEAFELWTKYVPAQRIMRFGKKENFWAMGDVGPCGPCSELLYDRGSKYGDASDPQEDLKVSGGERFLEFWNLVFMQYNRSADGKVTTLPKPSIDTGAGLERCMALIQDVESVFDTDILRSLIDVLSKQLNISYDPHHKAQQASAFRVIADHLRALAFAIADGAQPSNLDRGYVLRKILRRAVRYGRQLADIERPFLADLLPALLEHMGDDYPELTAAQDRISEILTIEEETFQRTLRRGKNMLGKIIAHAQAHEKHISGDDAFKLKDTYGFPIDEILLIAKDADLDIDLKRFQQLEKEAKERSRAVHVTTRQVAEENLFVDFIEEHGPSEFTGYSENVSVAAVLGIVVDNAFVDVIEPGQEGLIILSKTPFYAEMGGQIGDTGMLQGKDQLFTVKGCLSPYQDVIVHQGQMVQGTIRLGDIVTAQIDIERRQKIANNHTATHLLHWALTQVLGEHVKQAGSVVDEERLRFDFSHHKALSDEEIQQIEDLVNARIRENQPVKTYLLDYQKAQSRNDIRQFFGDKYGAQVRVVDIGFSKELCGGTHTNATGNIGYFRIAKEGSIAAGIRRIEAVTGPEAEQLARHQEERIKALAVTLKAKPTKLEDYVKKFIEENQDLKQQLEDLRESQHQTMIKNLLSSVVTVEGLPLLTAELDISPQDLKSCADKALDFMQSGIVAFGAKADGRCNLIVRISNDIVKKGISAKEIIDNIAPIVGGKGGGKAINAQAGGNNPDKLDEALAQVQKFLTP